MAITAVSANSSARSQCALPFIQIEIVKGRQLVLFYSTYNCGNALPHPCLHEFNRVRLLKTFGSRSEKNASTQIPPRNRKNAAITSAFEAQRRADVCAAFSNALTQRVNSQFVHNSLCGKADGIARRSK
jgi:hypothetical protein